ncbi:MAG TPA: PP2C family protein-serine/threonine phosphatase [Acidobacteriaceae bacterium]|nr:PP2C family protein-serine/threonine phosphatase [Acidobacteriaceae bacterium]
MPLARLRPLIIAVFVLISTFGYLNDILAGGVYPYSILVSNVLFSGLIACAWILILSRKPLSWLLLLIPVQGLGPLFLGWLDKILSTHFPAAPATAALGIRISAIGMMVSIVLSYVFFIIFIRGEGKESFKIRNELELAHGIQKTLVPPFTLRTAEFEVYGISKPSDKVGGDLVDALTLSNGDAIAYLGDIAGHGLQAGILMGMLKTATRTALLDAAEGEPDRTLPVLLDRLNIVLPSVKEAHMYATFSAFRLCADGAVYYALAASPPILHWHANGLALSKFEEEQFPLGLLDVLKFAGERMPMEQGDLVVVATDGVLEVSDKREAEFGVDGLEQVIGAHAKAELPELAKKILEAAQVFGRQVDDQTILLIRRVAQGEVK